MITLKVDLGERSYPIFIGSEILQKLGEMCQLYGLGQQVMVITDTNVQKLHGQELAKNLKRFVTKIETVVLPPGEKSKRLVTVDKIITKMLEANCDRKATILAFGGGVIGDIAGFTASIYKRGVLFVQVPTTLLAQVDASIGGKTGVNHPLGKNMIGTFYQPNLVWIDLEVLRTLPEREIICGLAEIIKYGIIWDGDLFRLVEENLDKILAVEIPLLQEVVKRCCEIKASIVAKDEKESGLRMVLNFGHTVGHALEAAMGYKKLNHGEAVLLGMVAESKMALDSGSLNSEEFNRIKDLILQLNLTKKMKSLGDNGIIKFIQSDKKALQDNLRFVLPKKIGEVFVADNVEKKAIESGINFLRSI